MTSLVGHCAFVIVRPDGTTRLGIPQEPEGIDRLRSLRNTAKEALAREGKRLNCIVRVKATK